MLLFFYNSLSYFPLAVSKLLQPYIKNSPCAYLQYIAISVNNAYIYLKLYLTDARYFERYQKTERYSSVKRADWKKPSRTEPSRLRLLRSVSARFLPSSSALAQL